MQTSLPVSADLAGLSQSKLQAACDALQKAGAANAVEPDLAVLLSKHSTVQLQSTAAALQKVAVRSAPPRSWQSHMGSPTATGSTTSNVPLQHAVTTKSSGPSAHSVDPASGSDDPASYHLSDDFFQNVRRHPRTMPASRQANSGGNTRTVAATPFPDGLEAPAPARPCSGAAPAARQLIAHPPRGSAARAVDDASVQRRSSRHRASNKWFRLEENLVDEEKVRFFGGVYFWVCLF